MTREPRFDNTAEGKRRLRQPEPHNRKPGGRADMRTLRWRSWRRETARWLRGLWRSWRESKDADPNPED